MVCLGLDCGGSSTRAMAVDPAGHVVFEGRGGPANWASNDSRIISASFAQALEGCPKTDRACACIAGLLTPSDRRAAAELVSLFLPEATVTCRPDYEAALAACPPGTTCCVIAGTGSCVVSSHNGQIVRSGGGGPLLGDEGSALGVARRAFSALLNDPSLRPGPALLAALEASGLGTDLRGALAKIYRAKAAAPLAASFAGPIAKDHADGCEYARRAIDDSLARTAAGHLRWYHSDIDSWRVSFSGGLWQASPLYASFFERDLKSVVHDRIVTVEPLDVPPVIGAVRLAQQMHA